MTWIVTGIALIGVILNIQRKWYCFLFWLISNAYWCGHNYLIREHAQAVLFAAFWFLSLYGMYRWKRDVRDRGKIRAG